MHDPEFLAAIVAEPDDDLPRLVYADWLDERGDPRGEFVRVQCELARLDPHEPRHAELATREVDLLKRHKAAWTKDLKVAAVRNHEFSRGFVETVTLNAKNHLQHGGELLDRVPTIRHLKVNAVNSVLDEFTQCAWLERLDSLNLTDNRMGTRRLRKLLGSPHLGNIQHLDLTGNGLGPAGLGSLVETESLPKLRRLNLAGNEMFDVEGADAVGRGPLWSQLTHVGLQRMNWGDNALPVFLENLPPTRWHTLDLAHNPFQLAGLTVLLESEAVDSLKTLRLDHGEMGADGCALLTSAPRLAGLEHLALVAKVAGFSMLLAQRPSDIDRIRALAHAPGSGRLRRLDLELHRGGETDSAVAELAGATGLDRLEELFLLCPALDPETARSLADSALVRRLRRIGVHFSTYDDDARPLLDRELGERLAWFDYRWFAESFR